MSSQKIVQFTKVHKKDGREYLCIHLIPEQKQELQDILEKEDWDSTQKLAEVFEYQLCNGWDWVRPEDIAALTDAPIISDSTEEDDHGNLISVDAVYYYEAYQVRDPLEELLQNGYVNFDCSRGE